MLPSWSCRALAITKSCGPLRAGVGVVSMEDYLIAVLTISKLPMDLGIDRERNRLHRAIAHHKITSAGVRTAEVAVSVQACPTPYLSRDVHRQIWGLLTGGAFESPAQRLVSQS